MARDPYKYFRVEARELADQLGQGLLELERSGSGGEIVPRLLRLAHTLKGAARVVRQPEIADHAHAIEGALSPFRELRRHVPRENVDAILRLIDGITGRVAALPAPESGRRGEALPPARQGRAARRKKPPGSSGPMSPRSTISSTASPKPTRRSVRSARWRRCRQGPAHFGHIWPSSLPPRHAGKRSSGVRPRRPVRGFGRAFARPYRPA